MPVRPPKAWFRKTVRSLSEDASIDDPKAVAGWIWHHHMTSEAKREALTGESPSYEPRRSSIFRKVKSKLHMFDPQELPEPIDIHGYDTTLVRVVPEVDQLMELQIKLPKHQWDRLLDVVGEWEDIEVDEKNKRIVRRGRLNKATNLFIDSE